MNKQTMLDKEGNEVEVEVSYEHWRPVRGVFEYDPAPKRGRPKMEDLYRYSRSRREDKTKIGFDIDEDVRQTNLIPHSTGGKTICSVRISNREHAIGVAWCSYSDPFNYRLGRQIAFGRALHKLGLH